jgi:Ca2+-binding EF-hand superfamily protein
MSKERSALTFDEMTRARYYFHKHADEYITTEFQMRTMLSEIGQFPPSKEISYVLDSFDGKVSFNNLCNYLCYLKNRSAKPEPKDVDTLRAFVALGGGNDRTGDISTEDLRSTCKAFQLTIDIDRMIHEVDEDGSGAIDYDEFAAMWAADPDEISSTDARTPGVPPAGPTAKFLLSSHGGLKPSEESSLEEEENLQLVKQFLFPLTRRPTAQNLAALSRKKSVANANSRSKSVVKLPPINQRGTGGDGNATQGGANAEGEGENQSGGSNGAGESQAKPIPAPPQHARQSVSGFVVPNPVILDLRGRGRSNRSRMNASSSGSNANAASNSQTPRGYYTPRKPGSGRKPASPPRSARV